MTTENTGTPAPAVVPNVPDVVAPTPKAKVDLSDLQAEADAIARQNQEDETLDLINAGNDAKEEPSEEDVFEDKAEEAETEEPKKPSREAARRARDRETIIRQQAEIAQLRSQTGSITKAQIEQEVESIVGPKPQEKDFPDSYLDYERALIRWDLDRTQQMRRVIASVEARRQEQAEQQIENVEQHKERVEQFRTRNGDLSAKDFDEVMSKGGQFRVSPMVEELILESHKSAHLVYFFA